MEAQVAQFLNRGMNQDISVSKASNEFAFENYNIRITAVNDNTLLSVTNEKGPQKLNVHIVKTGLINNKISVTNASSNRLDFKSEFPVTSTLKIVVSYGVEDHDGNMVPSREGTTYIYEGNSSADIFINEDEGVLDIRIEGLNTDDTYAYYIDSVYSTNDVPDYPEQIYNTIIGNYKGHAILNNYLILFTSRGSLSTDYVYRLEYKNNRIEGIVKYVGALGFYNVDSIETLPYYESEEVQKVYWADGINPIKFMNIAGDYTLRKPTSYFEVAPDVEKLPIVEITKNFSDGLFPAGVIQYYISYYNKYGAETALIWDSPLHYITSNNNALSPEDNIMCSFIISVSNIDTSYEYIRIYSCKRSSINGNVDARLVVDAKIVSDYMEFKDTNTNQEIIDATSLFFLNGEKYSASTLAEKDNVLFLGNLKLYGHTIDDNILNTFKNTIEINDEGIRESGLVYFDYKKGPIQKDDGYYPYDNSLLDYDSQEISGFKYGEIYRFAIQLQSHSGQWSNPVWIGDKKCELRPKRAGLNIYIPTAKLELSSELKDMISSYIGYRLLMAETSISTRSVLAQGFVSPTLFNYKERSDNQYHAISSWISRPYRGNATHQHLEMLPSNRKDNSEIQINEETSPPLSETLESAEFKFNFACGFREVTAQLLNTEYDLINSTSLDISDESAMESAQTRASHLYNKLKMWCTTEGFDLEALGMTETVFYNVYIRDESVSLDDWGFVIIPGVINNAFYLNPIILDVGESDNKKINEQKKQNNYYVDSSIVTFHSPEFEDVQSFINYERSSSTDEPLKFRIVGRAWMTSNKAEMHLDVSDSLSPNASTEGLEEFNQPNISAVENVLLSGYLYKDFGWVEKGDKIVTEELLDKYKIYLWQKEGSLIGQNNNTFDKDGNVFSKTHAKLNNKKIANHKYSYQTSFFKNPCELTLDFAKTFTSEDTIKLKGDSTKSLYYTGNYSTLLSTVNPYTIVSLNQSNVTEQFNPVEIKYKSTPHIVMGFVGSNNNPEILPYIYNQEDNYKFNIKNIYPEVLEGAKYPWGVSSYNQKYITLVEDGESGDDKDDMYVYPYMYIGELYRDIDYNTLYGGTSEWALTSLKWIPISKTYTPTENVVLSEGDTYFQRWDCLKTYPYTEEDLNSVIDINSFMVESHINLDGRYDSNRGSNILNVRPGANFNLYNPVYSQKNNLFSYSIIDSKHDENVYTNQITFSFPKIIKANIDTWSNISLSSTFALNGKYGDLNKIINFNDTLVTFQDRAISVINYNNRTALSVEAGVPIEIANSGKVNGYSVVSSNIGCINKNSICITGSGIYFIDDLNKSLFRFNKEGINNVSSNGMSMWFKKNLTGKEDLFYDGITHDIYIVNDNSCLLYNEDLQSFTSFMDYQKMRPLFNLSGQSFAIISPENQSDVIYKMFAGDYNTTFEGTPYTGYYTQYKVNPEPLLDKVFTNIEYIAEGTNAYRGVDDAQDSESFNPFTKLNVWTTFQDGETSIKDRYKYPNFERKFNLWRVDIPRSSNRRDRIRSPWMYLKLSSDSTLNIKSVFHSLLVYYYR